jgi:signal transduction protein with GAF and PtsI domain
MSTPRLVIDRAALQAAPLATLLRHLVRDAVGALGAGESTVWVPDADGTRLDAAINHGPTSAIVERLSVAVDDSVVGLVHMMNIGTCIGPDDRHNPAVDNATGTPTRAMVAVPIHHGQWTIGVLSAINPVEPRSFDHRDLAEMEWRAYLAGLIIGDYARRADPAEGSVEVVPDVVA